MPEGHQAPRHHRQMLLPQIGPQGQQHLASAHALIIGLGALGTVAAELLCRAGVGTLTLVDRDVVEPTNLQRQALYDETDARERTPKVVAAARRLSAIDGSIRLRGHLADFTPRSAQPIVSARQPPDVLLGPARDDHAPAEAPPPPIGAILDCTDNYEARFLVNDVAVQHDVPLVYAGAVATEATFMVVLPGQGPCLRCLFDPPQLGSVARARTCDTAGVLGTLTSMIASVQATEALKVLAGRVESVRRDLLSIDVWAGTQRSFDLRGARRPDCPCCALRRFDFAQGSGSQAPVSFCGSGTFQVAPAASGRLDLAALAQRLAPHGAFHANRFLARGTLHAEHSDTSQPIELTVFPDGRALVRGVANPERARAIVARYVGS